MDDEMVDRRLIGSVVLLMASWNRRRAAGVGCQRKMRRLELHDVVGGKWIKLAGRSDDGAVVVIRAGMNGMLWVVLLFSCK